MVLFYDTCVLFFEYRQLVCGKTGGQDILSLSRFDTPLRGVAMWGIAKVLETPVSCTIQWHLLVLSAQLTG